MMKTILYTLNLTILPLFFLVVLTKNLYTLTKQAIQWSVSQTKSAYQSNRRYYGKE
jgi:hypothetical protein